MSDSITTTDLSNQVHERIRSTIIDLLPQDRLKALVEREVENFLQGPMRTEWSGKQVRGEPLISPVIQGELQRFFAARIREVLESPEWASKHGDVAPKIEAMATEAAPGVLIALLTNGLQNAIAGLRAFVQAPK